MGKWLNLQGFALTRQDAADIKWLIDLALPHVTMNTKTKRRLSTLSTKINAEKKAALREVES